MRPSRHFLSEPKSLARLGLIVFVWAGVLLAAPYAQAALPGFSEYPGTGQSAVAPDTLDFCSSGCEYDGITWSAWGGPEAMGTGFFAPKVSGVVQGRWPVAVTLADVRTCLGERLYSRITITYTGTMPEGDATTTTNALGCPKVYYAVPYYGVGDPQVARRPTRLNLEGGDVDRLKWSSWTTGWDSPSYAKGKGRYTFYPKGRKRTYSAKVTLSDPGPCDIGMIYNRVKIIAGGKTRFKIDNWCEQSGAGE